MYLDFVDIDGYAIASTPIDHCADTVLIGTQGIPSVPISYQLRGYDINGGSFTQLSGAVITTQLPELTISLINQVVINPGMSTLGRLSLYNTKKGPQSLNVHLSVTVSPGLSVKYPNKMQTVSILPQEETEVVITFIGDDTLVHGDSLDWTVTATALCYGYGATNVSGSYEILVSKPIPYTTTTTPSSITIQWTPPDISGTIVSYTVVVDYDNGTVKENTLSNSQTSFEISNLPPYTNIFINLLAESNSDFALIQNIAIRTDEAGKYIIIQ